MRGPSLHTQGTVMRTLYIRALYWLLIFGRKLSARRLWYAGCGQKKFRSLRDYCVALPPIPERPRRENSIHTFLVLVDFPDNPKSPYWVWVSAVHVSRWKLNIWYATELDETLRVLSTHEFSCLRAAWPLLV